MRQVLRAPWFQICTVCVLQAADADAQAPDAELPGQQASPVPATAPPPPPLAGAPAPGALSAAALEAPAEVGYDKGFYIKQGINELAFEARLQTRYTHLSPEDGANENAFAIQRARLTLKGVVLMPELSYKFQADFGKGGVALKDFYFDLCVAGALLCIRPGQFKRPFSRQQIISSGRLELVDRAVTDKAFGSGRDIGVMLHDNYEKSPPFEYALGIFNGTGDSADFTGLGSADLTTGDVEVTDGGFSNVPDQWHPALGARLGYNYGGIKGYSEADLEGGGLRFAVGTSLETHFDADGDDDSLIKGELDAILKLHGFSLSGAVYHTSQQDGAGFGDRANGDGGAHVQLGYVVAGMLQPVVRYSIVDPRHLGTENLVQEYVAGLSYYARDHALKLQGDVSALSDAAANATDWLLRVQAQLSL